MKVKLDSISLLEKYREIKINKSENVKDNNKSPEDIIDISKRVIQATNGKKVQLTYTPYNNDVNAVILSEHGEKIEVKRENVPQELKNIQDVKHFQDFLKNAYAKVNVLSNGDYNLYVNHRLLGGSKEYLDKIINTVINILQSQGNISSQRALIDLDINDLGNDIEKNILFRAILLITGFIAQGIEGNNIHIIDINSARFKRTLNSTINHLKLCKGRLNNIIKVTDNRLCQRISSERAFEDLGIDYEEYINVDDSIIVMSIKKAENVTLQKLEKAIINIDNINFNYFKSAVDEIIFSKQRELIDSNSYDLLFPFKNGLNSLGNKIFNKEDPFTVHAVKCFFNSVDQVSQDESWIKNKLKDRRFVCHIYINLIAKFIQAVNTQFINNFNQFQIQEKPTQNEYAHHDIPKAGFCHGSCITIANLNSFDDRNEILEKSVLLQNEYIRIRSPSGEDVENQLILRITNKVNNLPEEVTSQVSYEQVKKLIEKNMFQKFLEEQNISIPNLLIESKEYLQNQLLSSAPTELNIFNDAKIILDDSLLNLESFNFILNFLNNKIQSLMKNNSKHMVLITLREKADISKAKKLIEQKNYVIPQTHNILLRVDTNSAGNINRIIFSDLQEAGLHIINATSDAKNIKDANPKSIELVEFYVKNSAINRFDEISAEYIVKFI